jgi:hypothetical protein
MLQQQRNGGDLVGLLLGRLLPEHDPLPRRPGGEQGVYDIASNAGWVSVGIDHDTASFAVNAIRRWWHSMGRARYPQTRRLLIADCGGSNGARVRLWKRELQALANELGLSILCHLPPGTSKWNRIVPTRHQILSRLPDSARGRTNQLNDRLVANQRLAAPVPGDE